MSNLTVGEIVESLKGRSWNELAQIADAARREMIGKDPERMSAAEVRDKFKEGMRVRLFGLSAKWLNGREAEVTKVKQTKILVKIVTGDREEIVSVPAICAEIV